MAVYIHMSLKFGPYINNQKLKCHHYVMTLSAFGLGAIGVNKDRIASSYDIFPEYF